MNFPPFYEIIPPNQPCKGTVEIPGSKSITNRLFILAALAEGTSEIAHPLLSVDTQMMRRALETLGVKFQESGQGIFIEGKKGEFPASSEKLYIENSGTSARFLLPALLLGKGDYYLDGNARMRERPFLPLLDAFRQMGCEFSCLEKEDHLPLQISAEGLPGGEVKIRGDVSSQYLSGLMMSAPYAQNSLRILIEGDLVSADYVRMTATLMEKFGAEIIENSNSRIEVSNRSKYRGRQFTVEADMSSASYFFAMAAITGGEITVGPIPEKSLQGDYEFPMILEKMGCRITRGKNSLTLKGGPLKGIRVDMNHMSDVAPTLAAVALFAEGETEIYNAENMRVKECDRIAAVATEFQKIGAKITENRDGWKITGNQNYRSASLETYDDHRMAMSFSLIGLKTPGIRIMDPGCVTKTFPEYFHLFFELCKPY